MIHSLSSKISSVLSLLQVVNLNRTHIHHSMATMVHHTIHPSMAIMAPLSTHHSTADTMVIMVHLTTHLSEDTTVKLIPVNRIQLLDSTLSSLEKRWSSSVKK